MNVTLDKNKLSLYYGEYQYKLKLTIYGIQYFKNITDLNGYHERLTREVYNNFNTRPKTISDFVNRYYNDDCNPISDFIRYKINDSGNNKKRISITFDSVIIYSNDFLYLENVLNLNKQCNGVIYKVNELTSYNKNNIYHKNPKHKFRIYLKYAKLIEKSEIDRFKKLILTNECRPSSGLYREITNKNNRSWTQSDILLFWNSYFIDVNDDKFITLLSLNFTGLVRKVFKIVQR